MKAQTIHNIFKMMIGTSALIASTAFFIQTISPVQASQSNNIHNNSLSEGMEMIGDYVYFVDAGYMYVCQKDKLNEYCKFSNGEDFMGGKYSWVGNKFTYSIEGFEPQTIGGKFKLP